MEIKVIASGSKGNCYQISDGETTLLLECGIPVKDIQVSIGFNLTRVRGCFISHSHQDHCKAAKGIVEKGVDVYAPQQVFDKQNLSGHRCHPIDNMKEIGINNFTIKPFECQHDVINYGYQIDSYVTNERLLFFTDSYFVKYKFRDLNYIIAECNYDIKTLNENVAAGILPEALKRRLLTSHMSLEHFIDFLKANDLSKVKQIYLAHMSDNNSRTEEYKKEIQKQTGTEVYIC